MSHKNRERVMTRHHTIPRAAGGKDQDVIMLPDDKHKAWHLLFGIQTPDQAMATIYYKFTTEAWREKHKEIEG